MAAEEPTAVRLNSNVAIRPARHEDLPRLTEIYNHYVRSTAITFDIDPVAVEERRADR